MELVVDKNWFGLESHPTDSYICFTFISKKQAVLIAASYRDAYDKIITAGLQEALDILTQAAYEAGHESGQEDI